MRLTQSSVLSPQHFQKSSVLSPPFGKQAEHRIFDGVELQAEHGRLIVRAGRSARAGWAEAARVMRARGDDQLLDRPTSSQFDEKEWRWR